MRTASEKAAERQVQTLLEMGAVGGQSDGRLLERFTAGDGATAEAAFATLMERYGPMVWRACRAILSDPNDADDAFQATFLVMVRRSRSLWARDSLGPWLLQVARRTSMQARSRAHRRRLRECTAAGLKPSSIVEPPPDELGAAIHEEVGRLPERYRAVVVLCLLEGLPDSQAAARLGWPLGTVHSRLARGREKLRRGLSRRGITPAVAALASSRTPTEAASAAVPACLIEATVRSASRLASLGLRDAALPAAVAALTEGVLRMTWLAKIQTAALSLAALGCVAVAAALGSPGAGEPAPAPAPTPEAAPTADPPTPPEVPPEEAPAAPVNSIVQILVGEGDQAALKGLGTIISSTQEGSIILTSSWILPRVQTDGSATPILVEPHEQGQSGAAAPRPESPRLAAEVVAVDAARELALLRIRPGRILGRARVVPPRWKPLVQMRVGIATRPRRSGPPFGASKILKVAEGTADAAVDRSILCAGPPGPDAVGGGLFTGDETRIGDLAGVGRGPVPDAPGVTAYAPPEAIYAILDASGLAHLYREPKDVAATSDAPPATESPAPASTVVDVVVRSASRPDLPVHSLGTVVASTPEATFVLTSFNGVEIAADPAGGRSQVKGEIRVAGLAAESVDVEPTTRLALLRFRPRRPYPTARVLPRHRPLMIGQDMTLINGLDPGQVPSTRPARILELSGTESTEAGQAGPPGVLSLLCDASPPGLDNGGAGLFVMDPHGSPPLAELAGVFQFILPERQRGLFIGPEAIHRLLDRNGLIRAADAEAATPSPVATPPIDPKIDQNATAGILASTVHVAAFGSNEPDPRSQGLGTVISSTPDQSIVLTCAHLVTARPDVSGGRRKVMESIQVVLDAIDPPNGAFAAEAVEVDQDRDLAVLRIRPGAILATTQLVQPSRRLVIDAPALRLDRLDPDRDGALEIKTTRIMALDQRITSRGTSWTSCTGTPKPGISGSGLYTAAANGPPLLVGICNYAEPKNDRGYYASPDMIYAVLDAAGLTSLYADEPSNVPPPEIADFRVVKEGLVALAVEGSASPIALGTVISSTEEESIALTAGSIFAGPEGAPADPRRFNRKVTVYYARPRTRDSVPIPPVWGTVGEVVDFDLARNVGLVRFRPERKLDAIAIVPTSWKATRGTSSFVSLNQSSDGRDAPRSIRDASVVQKVGDVDYEAIECEGSPAQTNVGSPLVVLAVDAKTIAIAGVCNYSSPQDDAGYYAAPAMIYHILDANGLSDLYRKGNEAFGLAPPLPFKPDRQAPAEPQPERIDRVERRVEEIDRKLDQILKALKTAPR